MDKVVHFDIPVEKPERASKFYQSAFGWRIDSVPNMDYWMVNTVEVDQKSRMPKEAGAINGGLYKKARKEDVAVIVVNVPSVDKALEKIKKAGGKVVSPKAAVGDMGFYAKIVDTEGNQIGVWEMAKTKK